MALVQDKHTTPTIIVAGSIHVVFTPRVRVRLPAAMVMVILQEHHDIGAILKITRHDYGIDTLARQIYLLEVSLEDAEKRAIVTAHIRKDHQDQLVVAEDSPHARRERGGWVLHVKANAEPALPPPVSISTVTSSKLCYCILGSGAGRTGRPVCPIHAPTVLQVGRGVHAPDGGPMKRQHRAIVRISNDAMADTQKQDDLLPEDEGKGGLCADKTAQLKSPVKPTALLDAKLKTKEVHANVNVPPASSKWGSSIRIRPEHQAELDQLRGQLLRSLEDKKKKKRAGICGTIVARNAALNVEQVLPSSSEIETNSLQQQINLSQGHGLDAQTAKDADGVRNIPPVDPLATSQTLSPHEEPGLEDQEDDLEALDVEEVESMLVVVDTRLRGE